MDTTLYQQARLSRDARFDGLFFIAVVSTGIYCRPICPAPSPKEENVRYYASAIEASAQGFRPCLRCRPDSAPGSPAWLGKETTFRRALSLIQEGSLQETSVPALAERLGVSDRYLRKLFTESLGCSPKQYALYQQILFAKKLLHETRLPISDVAFAAGFNSVRRFNDCFQQQLSLSPTQVRRKPAESHDAITLTLSYRPPYVWQAFHNFLSSRLIEGIEWLTETSYGRTFSHLGQQGRFTATHHPESNAFRVEIEVENPANLYAVVSRIRHLLDLDTNPEVIGQAMPENTPQGLRIPGCWDMYEAGLRAASGESLSQPLQRLVMGNKGNITANASDNNEFSQEWKAVCERFEQQQWPVVTPSHILNDEQYSYALLRGLGRTDLAMLLPQDYCNGDAAKPWRSYLAIALSADMNKESA